MKNLRFHLFTLTILLGASHMQASAPATGGAGGGEYTEAEAAPVNHEAEMMKASEEIHQIQVARGTTSKLFTNPNATLDEKIGAGRGRIALTRRAHKVLKRYNNHAQACGMAPLSLSHGTNPDTKASAIARVHQDLFALHNHHMDKAAKKQAKITQLYNNHRATGHHAPLTHALASAHKRIRHLENAQKLARELAGSKTHSPPHTHIEIIEGNLAAAKSDRTILQNTQKSAVEAAQAARAAEAEIDRVRQVHNERERAENAHRMKTYGAYIPGE